MSYLKKNIVYVYMILLLWLDLLTKYIFFNKSYFSTYTFFYPVKNIGISFSLWVSYFFVIPLTFVALFFFFDLYRKKYFSDIVFILFVAGTLGNLYDRLLYQWVRDFIVVFDWFVCNIADIYLSLALICVFYTILLRKE